MVIELFDAIKNIKNTIEERNRCYENHKRIVREASIEELIKYCLDLYEPPLSSRSDDVEIKNFDTAAINRLRKYIKNKASEQETLEYLYLLKEHFSSDIEDYGALYLNEIKLYGFYWLTRFIFYNAYRKGLLVQHREESNEYCIIGTDTVFVIADSPEALTQVRH